MTAMMQPRQQYEDGDERPTSGFSELLRALPFKVPARIVENLGEDLGGDTAAAALLAGPPPSVTVPGPAGPVTLYRRTSPNKADRESALEEAQQKRIILRRDAMLRCLTEKRMNCLEGLSILDKEHQHPGEIQAWLDDPDQRTLIIAGRAGNGKTQAAFAAAAQAARYGAMTRRPDGSVDRKPLLVRGCEVEQYLRDLRPEGSPEPNWAVRNRAVWAELYIGDDPGAEMDGIPSEFVRKEITFLLGQRLERNGRQIFTTNASAATLKACLGSRTWSRLQEQSTVIKFTGPDRRVTKELSW